MVACVSKSSHDVEGKTRGFLDRDMPRIQMKMAGNENVEETTKRNNAKNNDDGRKHTNNNSIGQLT